MRPVTFSADPFLEKWRDVHMQVCASFFDDFSLQSKMFCTRI